MAATGSPQVSPPSVLTVRSKSGRTACSNESPPKIWSCTSCKACDEICPVNIEILDKILDMRRYLSLMESNFPAELGNAYLRNGKPRKPMGNEPRGGDWQTTLIASLSTLVHRSRLNISTGSDAPDRLTTRIRKSPSRWRNCFVVRASTSQSSDRAKCAPAIRLAAQATSTSSRCWRCRISKCSTAWA